MKLKTIIILLLVLTYSCDEDLVVKDDFRQRYVLNCILRGDTTFQVATISSTYEVEGFSPLTNSKDPSVNGADIKIFQGNDVSVFNDSSSARRDTSRYKNPVNFYYLKDFYLSSGKEIEIEAVMPDDRRLFAKTETPKPIEFDGIENDRFLPPDFRNFVFIRWYSENENMLYDPKIGIIYYKKENGSEIKYRKEVPLSFSRVEGKLVTNYAEPSFNNEVKIEMGAVDSAMTAISDGDDNKRNYRIEQMVVDIFVYDRNLTGFFVAANFLDEYSIRLDEIDFSNVEGGYGVFGSLLKFSTTVSIDRKYITNFGYLPSI